MADIEQSNLTALTVDLLSAYFANNTVESGDLSGLIRSTHEALKAIDAPAPESPAAPDYKPAVTLRASLASKDHIVSLIDGKPYKTLKRHLSTNGLTPAEYRERYKLPHDYPMVAPTYSQARRDVAARLGLGRKPNATTTVAAETPVEAPIAAQVPTAPKAPAPKPKAKAPAKGATPATRTTVRKGVPATAKGALPSAVAATSAAALEASPPKKHARTPKAASPTSEGPDPTKSVTKRSPRKSKTAAEPAAS